MLQAIDVLQDLTHCIEVRMDFPFEHLLLDCIVLSMLAFEQGDSRHSQEVVEDLLITYLSLPGGEARERILRRMYQRLRLVATFQRDSAQAANNNYLLAKFLFRKKVVNQFVNGMLINNEVCNEESSALQMSVGQLLVKILIIGFNAAGGAQMSLKNNQSTLNSSLLTFQVLLPQYPELIGLLDLIEETAPRNCRYLRVLRDLYSSNKAKREFATSVL